MSLMWMRLAGVAGLLAVLYGGYQHIKHDGRVEGRAEVQTAWDADKAKRKAESDKQAFDTKTTNKEHDDALEKTKADLSVTRRDRDIALARLRNLPTLPGQGCLPVAGGGQTPVPGVADNPSGTGGGIRQRIGGCEDSGSDPCYASREFFEQAIADALDRGLTREWAAGQGIKIAESAK